MAGTDERETLVATGKDQGWAHRTSTERGDVFTKGTVRIRVIWQGSEKVSGATLFHDEMYESYTRDLSIIKAWLKR